MQNQRIGIEDFEFLKQIGQGAYGRVWLVKRKSTTDFYAMKIVNTIDNLTKNNIMSLQNESEIYDLIRGEFIVKALFKFPHDFFFCFVMEYMYGGDFTHILTEQGALDEEVARFYIAELILAINHLHQLGIVHRDLKPDNILIDSRGHIKLTDFGLSEIGIQQHKKNFYTNQFSTPFKNMMDKLKINEKNQMKNFKTIYEKNNHPQAIQKFHNIQGKFDYSNTQIPSHFSSPKRSQKFSQRKNIKGNRIIGTPDYIAPEIIQGKTTTNFSVDWWSLGVLLFEFIVGVPPFNDDSVELIFDNILNLRIPWDEIQIGYGEQEMTPEAKDLISKLLVIDPEKRLGISSIQELQNHIFFREINWNNLSNQKAPIIPEKLIFEDLQESQTIWENNPFENVYQNQECENKAIQLLQQSQFTQSKVRFDLLDQENQLKAQKFLENQQTEFEGKAYY